MLSLDPVCNLVPAGTLQVKVLNGSIGGSDIHVLIVYKHYTSYHMLPMDTRLCFSTIHCTEPTMHCKSLHLVMTLSLIS